MDRVIAFVDDLMFLSRIREAARAEALAALRAEPALAKVPVVGFFSHGHPERAREAREAGGTRTMPRSAFVQERAALLATPSGPDQPA
jgi:hypothetical protein